jgi:hypothetical protein
VKAIYSEKAVARVGTAAITCILSESKIEEQESFLVGGREGFE